MVLCWLYILFMAMIHSKPQTYQQSSLPGPPSYKKIEKKFCTSYDKYGTLDVAKKACTVDDICAAIVDLRCDNDGPFKLCNYRSELRNSSTQTCAYIKHECHIDTDCTESKFCYRGKCTTMVTKNGSVFTSPGYPKRYPNNEYSVYLIRFEEGSAIRLKVLEFSLEKDKNCGHDWLEIHDGGNKNAPVIGDKLCGNNLTDNIVSTGHKLFVEFQSDDVVTKRGFKIRAWAEG